MSLEPEYRRPLLEARRASAAARNGGPASPEHRSALRAERQRFRLERAQLRERLVDDRRYHKKALKENPWLVKLADFLSPRRKAREPRKAA